MIAADRDRLAELWAGLPRIALDHAVAEPAAGAGRVAVVPASFAWEDIGDFDALATLLAGRAGAPGVGGVPDGVVVLGDSSAVVGIDSTGLVVPAGGRVVAVAGLDDVVVVDTPGALLVTSRSRAQMVKRVVEALKESGRADLS
jgi:mannose-1-phosphate guanylyltransferase